jgi:hypothetical protein
MGLILLLALYLKWKTDWRNKLRNRKQSNSPDTESGGTQEKAGEGTFGKLAFD